MVLVLRAEMSKIPLLISPRSSSVPALPTALSACLVKPRAGGYVSLEPSHESENKATHSRSRGLRINECLKDPVFGLKKSKVHLEECDEMLAVTISCVMMMATDATDIPDEYFIWADNYLSRIKDNLGKNPPNVKGILDHIALLRPGLVHAVVGTCVCDEDIVTEANVAEEDTATESNTAAEGDDGDTESDIIAYDERRPSHVIEADEDITEEGEGEA
ncbi:uncharacterized protein LOC116182579 isoform X5 [Photinus pyralis]|nr:uncharacterized protein LOC116182579 isoform X5 [Photinus pyralis]XP_031358978.1 uncharacterized protein LOC116182579 isoform X5 [Photinus pyralis]XP_031358979.1 uncharacterized protein LOC116182579 isoform X5 [Photinus pyralis]